MEYSHSCKEYYMWIMVLKLRLLIFDTIRKPDMKLKG
jgi:hypothetical protein